LAHLFVAIVVLGTIAGIGVLLPKARRDGDVFGMAAAATVVLVSVSGCAVAIWLILTRRILQPALEDFLSVLLFGTLVWVLAFLLPHARRDHDPFAVVASSVAALLALLGWLLIGSRVFSG
jgi:uncharacterized membrane protein